LNLVSTDLKSARNFRRDSLLARRIVGCAVARSGIDR